MDLVRAPPLLALLVILIMTPAIADEPAAIGTWLTDQHGCKVLYGASERTNPPQISWSGDCLDGYVHGTGELTAESDGVHFKGEIVNGLLVTGVLETREGTFEGKFTGGTRFAEGTLTTSNGTIDKGVFWAADRPARVERTWPDGARYVGEIDSATGALEGNGTFYGTDGSVYVGAFSKNQMHGRGVKTYSDGTVYDGDFLFGKRHGKGKLTYPTGAVYEGEVANGEYQGKGELRYADGATYSGEFMSGKLQGYGVLKYASGKVYEGEFMGNEPHGRGRESRPGGEAYDGNFVAGRYQGKGKRTYADGSWYEGDFVSGQPHGRGTFHYADGGVYEGEFVGGERQGLGRYVVADLVRDGEWKSNDLNGKCKVEKPGIYRYEGECRGGVRHGTGHFEDPIAGVVYDGEFRANKYDGKGRLMHETYIYEGSFQYGLKHGPGKETHADGTRYEGEFAQDRWHGHGVLDVRSSDGISIHYDGTFVNGALEGRGALTVGDTQFEGEFKENSLNRGRITIGSGRAFEVDVEKETVLEVLPDGSTRPASDTDIPEFRL